MNSPLASELREEQRRIERSLEPLGRLRLAQWLGDEAVAQFARAPGVTPEQATLELERRRRLGPRRSGCLAAR